MSNEISQPSVSLTLVSADLEVANKAQKMLLVGQFIAGTVTAGTLVEDIGNSGEENDLFQRDSHLAEMVRAMKRIAPQVQCDAIPLVDASGTKAEYIITFTGTPTEAGTLTIIAGSDKNHKVTAAVTDGLSLTNIALAVVAAVNDDLDNLFTATNSAGVVTLTHNHKGTIGNDMPVGCKGDGTFANTIAGLTIVVTLGDVGATDPAALGNSQVFDTVGNRRYQGVVVPYAAAAIKLMASAWLDARFNTNNRILDGAVFAHHVDTFSNVDTAVTSLNSKSLIIFADETVADPDYFGPAMPEDPSVIATSFAAVRALRLTVDASLAQYLTTTASRDQYGGTALATLPYFNTVIPQLPITRTGKGFTDLEIESLLTAGATVIGRNPGATGNLVGEVPTTYKTDPAGNTDISWKFLNALDTMSQVREYFFNNLKKRFAQSRLTEGTVLRGRDMVNRATFEAYLDLLYGDLSGSDFALLQGGSVAVKFFKDNRTVVLDLSLGKVTVTMLTPIVTQTRTIIGTIQIVFSTEA
jgi:phage tail sheath gpL-like